MAKNIVLCSDGTGNSSIQGRGTNVFKLFEAVDLNEHRTNPRLAERSHCVILWLALLISGACMHASDRELDRLGESATVGVLQGDLAHAEAAIARGLAATSGAPGAERAWLFRFLHI